MVAPFSTFTVLLGFGHNFAPELGFVKIVILKFAAFICRPAIRNWFNFSACLCASCQKYNACLKMIFTVHNLTYWRYSFSFDFFFTCCLLSLFAICYQERKSPHDRHHLVFILFSSQQNELDLLTLFYSITSIWLNSQCWHTVFTVNGMSDLETIHFISLNIFLNFSINLNFVLRNYFSFLSFLTLKYSMYRYEPVYGE